MMLNVKEEQVNAIGELLADSQRPLKERFRALFTLRNIGGDASIKAIAAVFSDSSALLKHELAYCLGQMGDEKAIPVLIKVLEDKTQEPIVRHEAGEALGAIGNTSVLPLLEKLSNDSVVEVAETCQLAVGRIKWLKQEQTSTKVKSLNGNPFLSVDPTPPSEETDLTKLRETLLNESALLFDRYCAMFSLRNINTPESAKVIADGFKGESALFRHEIGYVLGQMACDSVVEELAAVVKNEKEHEMVRHEAAEALGCVATPQAMEVLEAFKRDPARVVRESCEVALDMSEYENSSEFQYADSLIKVKKQQGEQTNTSDAVTTR